MADRLPIPSLFGGEPLPPDTPITPGAPAPAGEEPIPLTPEQMQQDPMAQLVFILLQDPEIGPLILEQLERLMAAEEGDAPQPDTPAPPRTGVPNVPLPAPASSPSMPRPNPGPFTQALLNRR